MLINILLVLFSGVAQAQFEVPALSAPVMDQADIVEPQVEDALNRVIRDLHSTSGTQINVLTVPTLNDVPIEQASIQVTDQWKLGSAKEDKGALLLISMKERRMRIEVGQGLEGVVPDAIAKRIVDERIVPLMKAGRSSEAVLVGVASIAEFSDPEFNFASRLQMPRQQREFSRSPGGRGNNWIWILLLMLFIFMRPRRRRGGGLMGAALGYGLGRSHSGWGGGLGGGGFGGGGGWGGGGGGFSGGGASGGW